MIPFQCINYIAEQNDNANLLLNYAVVGLLEN